MKVNSTIYKGIEYVQVSALPPEQQESLLQTINRDLLIKIMVDGKLVGNCLQFSDYEIWFDNIYRAESKQSKVKKDKNDTSDQSAVPVSALKGSKS